MQPKSKFLYFLGAVAVVAFAYYMWQIPAINKAIGGTKA